MLTRRFCGTDLWAWLHFVNFKAGDRDRTRDVQLGNMPDVCLSNTSLFTTHIEFKEFSQNCKNDAISALNGVNGVLVQVGDGIASLTYRGRPDQGVPVIALPNLVAQKT